MRLTIPPTQLGIVKKQVLGTIVVVTFVMIAASALFYWISNAYVLKQAEDNITNLLLSHKGIHHYVQDTLIPAYTKYQSEGQILPTFYAPELLSSSYIVRIQHKSYNEERKNAGLPELYYKLAAINPRNPVNKADALEEKLIKMFNEHRDIKSYREIIKINGKENLYVAIPFLENSQKCMRCHSKREDSPIELQQRYPEQGGFNEKIGAIRAITSIRSPLEHERSDVLILVSTMFVGFATMVGLFFFNTRLRTLVQKRTLSLNEEIKERTHAEKMLQLTRISVEAASDALFWITPDTRIVDVNESACRSLDYTREEMLQMKISDFDHLWDEESWQRHFPELRRCGSLVFETEYRAKNGRVFPVEIVANYVNVENQEYSCAIVRDITDRKREEEKRTELEIHLRQAQKMEAIGTLAGGIAHDFNNILTPILGYSEIVAERLPEGSEERKMVQVIHTAGKRATELVQQILTFSRQSEQLQQPLQIHLIVKEALKLLRASIPTTITIHQNVLDCGLVMADPTQIHQIIMNLCTNAYHTMRETGGELNVSMEVVELTTLDYLDDLDLQPGPHVKLSVRDTGCGMSKEVVERIFEPYFTTKKQGEGTGLGLSMVHGIVKSHHGHITVYSEPGKGTEFHVYLPQVQGHDEGLDVEAGREIPQGSGTILVVDDEAIIGEMLRRMLSDLGYDVLVCSSSTEALKVFTQERERIALVLTDMNMPAMNGAELTRRIKMLSPEMPVVLCTGFSEIIDEKKAKSSGIDGFIMKPATRRQLAQTIHDVLEKRGGSATAV